MPRPVLSTSRSSRTPTSPPGSSGCHANAANFRADHVSANYSFLLKILLALIHNSSAVFLSTCVYGSDTTLLLLFLSLFTHITPFLSSRSQLSAPQILFIICILEHIQWDIYNSILHMNDKYPAARICCGCRLFLRWGRIVVITDAALYGVLPHVCVLSCVLC